MKLIATDLDGTLLDNEGKVSKENAEAIKRARELGIKFVVATGRSYDAARFPLQEVNINCPIISLNGALTYKTDQTIINQIEMDKEVARKILEVCQKHNMYIEFFTNSGIYSESREGFVRVLVDIMRSANPTISEQEIWDKANLRFQAEPVTFIDHYDKIFEIENLGIFKVLVFSTEQNRLKAVHKELERAADIAITSSGNINLEFNHPDAQKGFALKYYARQLGIDMKDVMTLGDNWNDASMLEMAGRGVAMANAADEIKRLCPYTTKSNIDHGVAVAIEEMLASRSS